MYKFEVWAPKPSSVSVEVDGQVYEMQPGHGGWWSCNVDAAKPGSEYGFQLDGAKTIPDPRSGFQPHGIHGLSQIVDHSAFQWTDARWQAKPLSSGILYELHIGTYTKDGTFRSAIEKLDHLVDVGITHVEIMPVQEFSGCWGWGYDGVCLYAPHNSYGTPDDFKALIDACHNKGLAVILDVVYNHLGPVGNYLPQFGPYFTDAYNTPWGSAVNLDGAGSDDARRFFIDNALMWLRDYHIDGLRLDAIHAFQDDSAIHFLEQLSNEVDQLAAHLGRHLVVIAESDLNDPRVVLSRDAGGYGMDAQWSDDFHHALHPLLTGERTGIFQDFSGFQDLAVSLQKAFVFGDKYSTYRRRRHGRSAASLSGHRFVAFSQNHDQIGNRPTGERLSHLVSVGLQKIAAALVLTSPFVPMLFMGEEFSASTPFQYFTQHEEEELARQVTEGRKNEFAYFAWDHQEVPDPQHSDTFHRSKLNWDEVHTGVHAEMLAWYKELIALRRQESALTDGRMAEVSTSFSEHEKWFVLARGPVEVVCNFSNVARQIPTRTGFMEVPAESVKLNKR